MSALAKSWEGKYKDPVRPVDFEFASLLEVIEREVRAMPGSWIQVKETDPRLSQAKIMLVAGTSVGPRAQHEIAYYETMCVVRHRPTGTMYVAFRQTMDLLLKEQDDLTQYPEWLMKNPVKRTELKIHIAKILRKPGHRYDTQWIEFLPETLEGDRVFDAIAWFLRTKNIVSEEMYGAA